MGGSGGEGRGQEVGGGMNIMAYDSTAVNMHN